MARIKTICAIGLLLCSNAFAVDHIWLTVNNIKVDFIQYENPTLTISANCLEIEKKVGCQATEAYKKAKKIKLDSHALAGGRNPGSVNCKSLGGKIIIAVDVQKDERSVCQFTDGSLIDCGSLY